LRKWKEVQLRRVEFSSGGVEVVEEFKFTLGNGEKFSSGGRSLAEEVLK
jgi:hypothetical protein